MLTQKKPVATPKSVNWHWFFLVFFGFFLVFLNFQICIGFFWFFLVFFGIGFGQNSKLETGFFWFFLAFLVFFWHKPWPTFEIGNWFFGLRWFFWLFFGFFGIFWFFWYLNLGLDYHPKKYQKNQKKNQKKPKKPKKKPKKTSCYTKIGK